MKKRVVFYFIFLMLLLAACFKGENTFRVGVILTGAVEDGGHNESFLIALTKIQSQFGSDGFHFEIRDQVNVADAAQHVDMFVEDDVDLIIFHGGSFGEVLPEIAKTFPEQTFAWGPSSETFEMENVFAYDIAARESGYLNGALAAAMSQSGVAGIINTSESKLWQEYTAGFTNGAQSINPDIKIEIFSSPMSDKPSDVSKEVEALIVNGADVLTGIPEGAVQTAVEQETFWLGTFTDHADLAPDIVIASQVYDWTVVLDEIFFAIEEGKTGGETFYAAYENSGILLRYNANLALPSSLIKLGDEIQFELIDGFIEP